MALERRPKLVVLDSELGDWDALSFVRALRQSTESLRPPLIVLGADDSGHEEMCFLEAGADAYLKKPLNLETLDRIVTGFVELAALR